MRASRFVCALFLVTPVLTSAPAAAQACRGYADVNAAEACLLEQVDGLRSEIEASFHAYVELLPSTDARAAQASHDSWERYLEDECRDAGERYRGGAFVLVEILSCEEWGGRQRALQLRLLIAALRGGDFVYDPSCFVPTSDLVELTGWVEARRSGDAPTIMVLSLDHPLCTDLGDGPQVVAAVQLVGMAPGLGRRAHRFHGVRATLQGRLFLPHLPFHVTPLVVLVQGLDPER